MRLALFQPDIPQNVGACIRLSACFGVALHVIEPTGFRFDDRAMKRAALDY
ncbi:MAG: TrmH family RNA methyltransferase, partial [Pseudomonadota bacterium]|nr:TrmH family RNA methyltransferase [Pseudomonadota bacterium]